MITLPYTDRDYTSIFNDLKQLIETIEPRAEVGQDKANVESIITKIIAGCVDTLSYNQDANILEAFPSTAKSARAIFDLLSIVGYTPKTARCCHVYMTMWNPNYLGEINYDAFNHIMIDGKTFYNVDRFRCAQGITTTVNWYQGELKAPDRREKSTENTNTLIDNYYPNLSINTIQNNKYHLPDAHTKIDSETVRIYTDDGRELTYVENPYMTNITKSSFSIQPSISGSGYTLVFSKDVSSGACGENFYLFYLVSGEENVGTNLTIDFGGLTVDNNVPTFSYTYNVENYKGPETADEARENVVYEFGWRDTPKAIITKYDAERAVLQNFEYISAVSVRDGNDFSGCDPSMMDIQVFCKVNEDTERKLNAAVADGLKNRLQTHFNKFKMLPLKFTFNIDNIITTDFGYITELYYWYPDITIYLKEQVNSKDAAAIINSVTEALFERFSTKNTDYNSVPRIVDIIETVQNASNSVLYLDIDGVSYMDANGNTATKEDVTCTFSEQIPTQDSLDYELTLNTKDGERYIQYNTIKLVNNYNEIIAYDNGSGVLLTTSSYLSGYGSIDYKTGKLTFSLSKQLADGMSLQILYKQETPCYCEYINAPNSIKIALESLKP